MMLYSWDDVRVRALAYRVDFDFLYRITVSAFWEFTLGVGMQTQSEFCLECTCLTRNVRLLELRTLLIFLMVCLGFDCNKSISVVGIIIYQVILSLRREASFEASLL